MPRPEANIDLEELEKLCVMQCTDEEIAAFFGVSTRTIERRRKVQSFRHCGTALPSACRSITSARPLSRA